MHPIKSLLSLLSERCGWILPMISSFNVVRSWSERNARVPGPSSRNKHANRDREPCVWHFDRRKSAPRVCVIGERSTVRMRACVRARSTKCGRADRMTDGRRPRAAESGDSRDTSSHSPTHFQALDPLSSAGPASLLSSLLSPSSSLTSFFSFLPSLDVTGVVPCTTDPHARIETERFSSYVLVPEAFNPSVCIYFWPFRSAEILQKYHALSATSNNSGEEDKAVLSCAKSMLSFKSCIIL